MFQFLGILLIFLIGYLLWLKVLRNLLFVTPVLMPLDALLGIALLSQTALGLELNNHAGFQILLLFLDLNNWLFA